MNTFRLTVKIFPFEEEMDCDVPEGTSAGKLIDSIVQRLGLQEPADGFCLVIGGQEYLADDILQDNGIGEAWFSYKKQMPSVEPITIILRVMPQGDELDIEVTDVTSTFGDLKKILIEQGIAPASDLNGNPYVYEFVSKNTNKRCPDEALVTATVGDGEVVYFMPKLLAGGPIGIFLYDVPTKMALKRAHRCTFRVAGEEVRDQIYERLNNQDATIETIRLGKVMKVTLTENAMRPLLHIAALSETEQFLVDDAYTEWLFDLTPNQLGLTSLILRVSIVELISDGREKSRDVLVLNKEILIESHIRPEDAFSGMEYEILQDWQQPYEWNTDKKNTLIEAVSQNNTGQALSLLANFLQKNDPELHKSIILLQAQWNNCKNVFDLNLIDFTTWHMQQSKINYALIDIIRQIDQQVDNSGKLPTPDCLAHSTMISNLRIELSAL